MMNNGSIATKRRNLELWKAGCFGNTLRTWDSVAEAIEDKSYEGPYTVRARVPQFKSIFGIPGKWELIGHTTAGEGDGYGLYVNEAMPEHRITIQGEVWRGDAPTFLPYMHYSDLKDHMKVGLTQKPMHAEGSRVRVILAALAGRLRREDLGAVGRVPWAHRGVLRVRPRHRESRLAASDLGSEELLMSLRIYHFEDEATGIKSIVLSHQGPKAVIANCAQGLTLLGVVLVLDSEAAPGADSNFSEHMMPLDQLLSPEEV